MKKLLLLLFLLPLLFFSQKSYGSHMMGCDITYKCIDTLKFEVTLTWYRDCTGIALNNAGQMTIRCGSTARSVTLTLNSISEITPFCPTDSARCNPTNIFNTGSGIEKHIYKGIIDFNTAPFSTLASCSGRIIIGAGINSRNNSITTGPRGTLYNDVELDLNKAPCNSSPIFTTEAVGQLCCDQPFYYNIGASDTADRDSLSYSFAPPRRGYNQTTSYSGGFSYANPFTAYYPGPLSFPYNNPNTNPPIGIYLDEKTGDLVLTPTDCQEITVLVLEVTEWRKDTNGIAQIIGKSSRDMQFEVSTCPNNNPPAVAGPYSHSVCEGGQICFNITTSDPVFVPLSGLSPAPDTTELRWNEGILGATFTIISDTVQLKTGRFCWTPPAGTASSLPYTFTATVEDNACPLKSRTSRQYRISVKQRAEATSNFTELNEGKYAVSSEYDTSSFKGLFSIQRTFLDSTGNVILDSKVAKFMATNDIVSVKAIDTLVVKKNGPLIVKTRVNNNPFNCPETYLDTLQIDSIFDVLILWPNDTLLCATENYTLTSSAAFPQGAINYQWYKNGNALTNDTFSTLIIYAIDSSSINTFSLSAQDSAGNTNEDYVVLRTKANYKNEFLTSYSACIGDSIILTIDSAYVDVMWNSNPDSVRVKNFYASEIVVVNYTDTAFGCHYMDSISIVINPLPTPELRDTSTCGSSLPLFVTNGPFSSHLWSNYAIVDTLEITATNFYYVTVTDSNGCLNSDSAEVYIFNADTVTLIEDSSQCGGMINLSSNVYGSHLWNTGSTSSGIAASLTGTYTVSSTDINGCNSTDSVQIEIYTVPRNTLDDTSKYCTDDSAVLVSATFSSYTWSNGDTTRSTTLHSDGIASVTFIDAQGCQGVDSTYIILNPLPVQTLSDTAIICDLESVSTSPFAKYVWSSGDTTRSIVPKLSGNYIVSVTDDNRCSSKDSIFVTLLDLPSINLGNDTGFCKDSVILSAGSFTKYLWNTGDTASQITIASNGEYSVQVIGTNGCAKSDRISLQFYMATPVSLGTDTAFCGDSALLTIPTGNSYVWSTGDTLNYTSINTSGDYSVTLTDTNGCSSSDTVNVSFYTNLSTPILTRFSDSVKSNLTGIHYWFLDDLPSSDANTNSIYINNRIGSFTAVHQDTNGCISDTSNSITRTAGIRTLRNSALKVYPNPSTGKVTIDLVRLGTLKSIKIYDNMGTLVENKQQLISNQAVIEWTARSGVLWIVVETDEGVYRAEVVSVR